MRQTSATPGQAISLAAGGHSLGYKSRSHVYRLVDPRSPWFDPELYAIVHQRPNGTRYFIVDELDALLRSRCSATAPVEPAA